MIFAMLNRILVQFGKIQRFGINKINSFDIKCHFILKNNAEKQNTVQISI